MPAYVEGARRYFATVVFVSVLASIIVASGSRVSAGIDRAQDQREQASRASKVATDTEHELSEILKEARATAKKACEKARTKACVDAQKFVGELVGKWTTAGATLATAPVVAGEGDVARISAWTMGYLTERQVALYLPLLCPTPKNAACG